MNVGRFSFAAFVTIVLFASQTSAQTIVAGPTTSNRLFDGLENLDFRPLGVDTDQPGIGARSRISAGGNANARGTSFSIGDAGETFGITGFTLQSATATTFGSDDVFTVAIFSGNATGLTISPAAGTDANVNPTFLDANSSLSLLNAETFAADSITGSVDGNGATAGREFITFNFADTLTVDGGDDLTAFVFTNFEYEYVESGSFFAAGADGVQGGRFQFESDTTVFSPPQNRNLNFAVLGEVQAVPEPSSIAILGLGTLLFAGRRRS